MYVYIHKLYIYVYVNNSRVGAFGSAYGDFSSGIVNQPEGWLTITPLEPSKTQLDASTPP
jgi:hypothetical protein